MLTGVFMLAGFSVFLLIVFVTGIDGGDRTPL
jgi:hypothetical protein